MISFCHQAAYVFRPKAHYFVFEKRQGDGEGQRVRKHIAAESRKNIVRCK